MTIDKLIAMAKDKDSKFVEQINYRLNNKWKGKTHISDTEYSWLFKRLEDILGKDFLESMAREQLKEQPEEVENG